jgi:dienelactone hydrolase
MKFMLSLILPFMLVAGARAEIKTETVEYKDGSTALEGYMAYDPAIKGKRPGILVVHEWTGLNDYAKMRTDMLAKLGYVAFAVDMYGKGIRPKNSQEAGEQASIYRKDRALMRRRVTAGLNRLLQSDLVDSTKIAAIGYCFGGGVVLELARSGANVNGVVSFHGNLDTPNPADAKNIKGKVLALCGADDPHCGPDQVNAFEKEMDDAGVDWYLTSYGHAVHGFTNAGNGDDPSRGVAYNAEADHRSWRAMQDFFNELFK